MLKTIKNNKESKKYKLTPLEKRFVKIYILLAVFYSIASVYLLNTPINEWVFNLGQYNSQLLQWFPKAQYWVNVSVAFREKMIPLYVIHQGIIWFGFFGFFWLGIRITKGNKYYAELISKNYAKLIFFWLIAIILMYWLLVSDSGSKTYLLYQDIDPFGFFNDIMEWNRVYGFVIARASAIVAVFTAILGFIALPYIFFLKIKHDLTNKGE